VNWAGLLVALGFVAIAAATAPGGLVLLVVAGVWLWRRS